MEEVTRKGFVDKNGKQVAIVPKVPGSTEGNLPKFDAEGNLQDSGIDAGLVGNAKFLYRLGIQKSGGAYVWSTSTTQAMLEEVYSTLSNGPSDAIPVRVQIPGFIYAGYATKGQMVGVKELHIFVGTVAFQVYYNTTSNQWSTPILISSAIVLDALKSTEQLSSGNDIRLITSGAVNAAINEVKIPLIHLQQAADESSWEPNVSYDSIYTAACSWGKTRPVLVRFQKIDTFDVTLIGTLSANFNSADGTAVAVICAGGYKFVRRHHSPANSIEELIWDNGGVTKTAISL